MPYRPRQAVLTHSLPIRCTASARSIRPVRRRCARWAASGWPWALRAKSICSTLQRTAPSRKRVSSSVSASRDRITTIRRRWTICPKTRPIIRSISTISRSRCRSPRNSASGSASRRTVRWATVPSIRRISTRTIRFGAMWDACSTSIRAKAT